MCAAVMWVCHVGHALTSTWSFQTVSNGDYVDLVDRNHRSRA